MNKNGKRRDLKNKRNQRDKSEQELQSIDPCAEGLHTTLWPRNLYFTHYLSCDGKINFHGGLYSFISESFFYRQDH